MLQVGVNYNIEISSKYIMLNCMCCKKTQFGISLFLSVSSIVATSWQSSYYCLVNLCLHLLFIASLLIPDSLASHCHFA